MPASDIQLFLMSRSLPQVPHPPPSAPHVDLEPSPAAQASAPASAFRHTPSTMATVPLRGGRRASVHDADCTPPFRSPLVACTFLTASTHVAAHPPPYAIVHFAACACRISSAHAPPERSRFRPSGASACAQCGAGSYSTSTGECMPDAFVLEDDRRPKRQNIHRLSRGAVEFQRDTKYT